MTKEEYLELKRVYKYANWVLIGCSLIAVVLNYCFLTFLARK